MIHKFALIINILTVKLSDRVMAEQDDHFTLNFTPTKQKFPNEFRLITSPPNKKEFDLYN